MRKRFQEVLLLVFLRQRRNLFVEIFNINRICPSGANLAFFCITQIIRLRRWRRVCIDGFAKLQTGYAAGVNTVALIFSINMMW